MLLKTSEDETIHRVAAGAIANLAMNGKNVGPQFKKKNFTDITILANKVYSLIWL